MIQSLHTNNDQLKRKFSTLEKDTTNLTNKTQSITGDTETLSKRICTVECINWNLSKGYDRLTNRISLQEGNMHAIKIMSKDETLSLPTDFTPLNSQ